MADDHPRRQGRPPDPAEQLARERLQAFFSEHNREVFYSRQLEIFLEDDFFHWITPCPQDPRR